MKLYNSLYLLVITSLGNVVANAFGPDYLPSDRKHVSQEALWKSRLITDDVRKGNTVSESNLDDTSVANKTLGTENLDADTLDANKPLDSDKPLDISNVPESCIQNKFSIRSASDVKLIDHCSVVIGDIDISEYKDPLIVFEKLETIDGSLNIQKSPDLVRLDAPYLSKISKDFRMSELTSLALVSCPRLSSIKVLSWKVLPILSNVLFNNEMSDIKSITISDTSLTGFSGFQSKILDTLDISNNRFLETITSNVEVISGKLHVAANSKDVIANFSKLKSANNLSIHDVAEICLNHLESVNNSAVLVNNAFTSLKLPKLSVVGGTLSLLQNKKLNQAEFPSIKEIGGGLMIVNNTFVDKLNFFPKLKTIGGGLDLVGNFKEMSMSQLILVKGSAKLKSYSNAFDCQKWTKSSITQVIRGGKIECTNSANQRIVSNTPTFNSSFDIPPMDVIHESGTSTLSTFAIPLLLVFSMYFCLTTNIRF